MDENNLKISLALYIRLEFTHIYHTGLNLTSIDKINCTYVGGAVVTVLHELSQDFRHNPNANMLSKRCSVVKMLAMYC